MPGAEGWSNRLTSRFWDGGNLLPRWRRHRLALKTETLVVEVASLLCTVHCSKYICLPQCQVNPILWKDDRLQLALTVDQSLSMDSPQPWRWQPHERGGICYDVSFSMAEIGPAPGRSLTCVSIFALGRSTAPDIRFDWPEGGVGAADLWDPLCSGVSNVCCAGRQDMCTQVTWRIYI